MSPWLATFPIEMALAKVIRLVNWQNISDLSPPVSTRDLVAYGAPSLCSSAVSSHSPPLITLFSVLDLFVATKLVLFVFAVALSVAKQPRERDRSLG